MKVRQSAALAALVAATGVTGAEEQPFSGGLAESLAPDGITVSGISSGGYMAQQLHLAFADRIDGVGVLAAGPWGCAKGNIMTALGACMGADKTPDVAVLQSDFEAAVAAGTVASRDALAGDRAWILHGIQDKTVSSVVAGATTAFYEALLDPDAVMTVDEVPVAHTFPTLANGPACNVASAPFVASCDFDAAGALLGHLLGPLEDRVDAPQGWLETLAVPDAAAASLLDTAYVYVPAMCREAGETCRTHVVFHGCAMSSASVGTGFLTRAGYLEWADSNGLVVLFPQVLASGANPYGCWDWWGYSGSDFQTRDGKQMQAVVALIDRLRGD